MAYTRLVMQPLVPSLDGMPSIGSATENWTRGPREPVPGTFSQNRDARLIRYMYGQCDYEEYVEYLQAAHRRRQEEDAQEAAEAAEAEAARQSRKVSWAGSWLIRRSLNHARESISSIKAAKSSSHIYLGSRCKRMFNRILRRRSS